jgi:alpha-D-ribose 1-methylphosphonate 5-triphosphate synthase subunit PhnG
MPSDYTSQATYLTVLCAASAGDVKQFVDTLLPELGPVEVLRNRTGLVMLPCTDTAQATTFHLGEVLVSEAHVRLGAVEGYGACAGRDLQQSLAIAILDAAMQARVQHDRIVDFVRVLAGAQMESDAHLLRQVEATRVEMETF